MKKWNDKDLERLRNKGLVIHDKKTEPFKFTNVPVGKVKKISVEKNTIQYVLETLQKEKLFDRFTTELKFDIVRRFRFDWAIPSLRIAIEYEGIFSDKSRHTTVNGFSKDCEKYNLALSLGWRVLRYTSKNYQELENDLKKLLQQ